MKVLDRKLDTAKTKEEYRRMLWIYDFWGWLTERKAAKKVLKLASIKDGYSVLDAACGTGEMLKNIVKSNPNGENIGIDISHQMLSKASKKLSKFNKGNYKLLEGDVLSLDFSDNSFNVLINSYMIDLLPVETFNKIASEFYRVLKTNGVVVISTFSFGNRSFHRFWYWVAKWAPSLLTGCRPVRFKDYLIKAGFKIEKIIEVSQNTFPSQIIMGRK